MQNNFHMKVEQLVSYNRGAYFCFDGTSGKIIYEGLAGQDSIPEIVEKRNMSYGV